MESSTENSGGLRQELRGDAGKLGQIMAQRVASEVDTRKGAAASQAKTLSSALGKAAGELGSEGPGWLRTALERGARSIQHFAETIEQKDAQQLNQQVQRLARDNPGTFLAGCALAGFAAARIMRAGAASTGGANSEPESVLAGSGFGAGGGIDVSGNADPMAENRPATPGAIL